MLPLKKSTNKTLIQLMNSGISKAKWKKAFSLGHFLSKFRRRNILSARFFSSSQERTGQLKATWLMAISNGTFYLWQSTSCCVHFTTYRRIVHASDFHGYERKKFMKLAIIANYIKYIDISLSQHIQASSTCDRHNVIGFGGLRWWCSLSSVFLALEKWFRQR